MEMLTRIPAYFVAHFKVLYQKWCLSHKKNTPVIMHLSYGSLDSTSSWLHSCCTTDHKEIVYLISFPV